MNIKLQEIKSELWDINLQFGLYSQFFCSSQFWLFYSQTSWIPARIAKKSEYKLAIARLQPPVPQTALSVALRATFPQHPIPH